MKIAFRAILLLLGLGLFGWFVHRAGPGEIWRTCASLGWYAPLALIPYGVVYGVDTLGWKFAFAREAVSRVGFWSLFRVRWCGEAVNNVVPSAYVGGEAVKVYLLRKRGVAIRDATASVIVGRTVQTLTQVMFIALGSAAFLSIAQPTSAFRQGMIAVLVGSLAAIGALFWLQSRGMFSILFAILERLKIRIKSLESNRAGLEQVDRQVVGFYRHDRGRFFKSTCFYLGGWLLDTMDIFLVSWLVGMPISWSQALAIEAFIGVAKVLGLFVPGALGVQESGIALVCRMAGLPDALGLSYAIIRRGREVIYASFGWLLLYAEEATLKGLSGKVAAQTKND